MRMPTDKEIKRALDRASQECPKGSEVKIIDTAWTILSWEYAHVDERRIEDQLKKQGEK